MTDLRSCCQQANHNREAVCGWCRACYQRWVRAGRPEDGPPPPMTPEERAELCRTLARGRREDCAELRSWGLSQKEAAARMGVHRKTVQRYERISREQAVA